MSNQNSTNETTNDMIKSGRIFLHDVSNHLVVSQGMASYALKKLKKEITDPEDKILNRLEKSIIATNKIIDLVKNRREYLHLRDEKLNVNVNDND